MSSTESIFTFDRQKLHSKLLFFFFFWRIFPEALNHARCIACLKLHLFREIRSWHLDAWNSLAGCIAWLVTQTATGKCGNDEWWTHTIIQPPPSPASNVDLLTPYTEESYLLISLCFPVLDTDKPMTANKSKLLLVAHFQTTSLCTWK